MTQLINLNGQLVPQEQAVLPVSDRGVLFGDGVYEVMAVHNGAIRSLKKHQARLNNSLEGLGMQAPFPLDSLEQISEELLKANHLEDKDALIYLQITRGVSEPRDFNFDADAQSNYFMRAKPFVFASLNTLSEGYKAISHEDIRRADCYIKSICLQPSALLKHKAANADCEECLLHRNGMLTEGSSSNVFMVKDGVIKTPPLTRHILPGVTRALVIQLCEDLNIKVIEEPITFDDLYHADEVFITSTSRTIKPIIQLDDTIIGDGTPGPIWYTLIEAYQNCMQHLAPVTTKSN